MDLVTVHLYNTVLFTTCWLCLCPTVSRICYSMTACFACCAVLF